MRNSSRGFTLIELLISITIITILATLGIIAYQSVTKKGRDGKRQTDLKTIQGALQQYYADKHYFPTTTAALTTSPVYLKTIPQDPSTLTDYTYQARPNGCDNSTVKCTDYCIIATLEMPTSDRGCATNASQYGVSTP